MVKLPPYFFSYLRNREEARKSFLGSYFFILEAAVGGGDGSVSSVCTVPRLPLDRGYYGQRLVPFYFMWNDSQVHDCYPLFMHAAWIEYTSIPCVIRAIKMTCICYPTSASCGTTRRHVFPNSRSCYTTHSAQISSS